MNCFKKDDMWQAIRLHPSTVEQVRRLANEHNASIKESLTNCNLTFFTPSGNFIVRTGDFIVFNGRQFKAYKPVAFVEEFVSIDDDWYKHIAKECGWDPDIHGIIENWMIELSKREVAVRPEKITPKKKVIIELKMILLFAIPYTIVALINEMYWMAIACLPAMFVTYWLISFLEFSIKSIFSAKKQLRETTQLQEEAEES